MAATMRSTQVVAGILSPTIHSTAVWSSQSGLPTSKATLAFAGSMPPGP